MTDTATWSLGNSEASSTAQKHAIRYPGRHHPDSDVFQYLEQRLRGTGNINTHGTRECWSPTDCTDTTNEDTVMAAEEREPWRCHAISHKRWDYRSRGSTKYCMTISCIHVITLEVHNCSRLSSSADEILRVVTTSTLFEGALFT
jgi:hypothetical protein